MCFQMIISKSLQIVVTHAYFNVFLKQLALITTRRNGPPVLKANKMAGVLAQNSFLKKKKLTTSILFFFFRFQLHISKYHSSIQIRHSILSAESHCERCFQCARFVQPTQMNALCLAFISNAPV